MLKQVSNRKINLQYLNETYILHPIENIVLSHFQKLSTEIADNLIIYELLYQNIFNTSKISKDKEENFDHLAEQIDDIINEQKIQLCKNLEKVISDFL